MVQLSTSVVIAAILAGPALAAPMVGHGHQHTPGVSHLHRREPRLHRGHAGFAGATTQATARDLEVLEDLIAREPFLKKVLGVAKKVGGTAVKVAGAALSGRELEELEELAARDPLVRNLVKKVAGAAKRVGKNLNPMPPLGRRELEDPEELAARDPLVRNLVKKVAGAAKRVGKNLNPMPPLGRDLENIEEIVAREYYDELD